MTERLANEIATSLSAAINASQTSITVTSATGFPAANFRIRIDNELMLVTGVAGTTWTVTRAVESTTAASHAILADVSHILTAGGLQQAITEAGTGAHPAAAVGSTDPTLATVTITLLANPTVSIPTSAGSDIEVEVRMTTSSTGADSINLYVRNDGGSWVLIGDNYPTAGGRWDIGSFHTFVAVTAATHLIEMGWSNSGGVTATSYGSTRRLKCKELR